MPEADRTRLSARVTADYLGFSYAPVMPVDLISVANIAADISSASLGATAGKASVAASRAQTLADRIAVSAIAQGAAGIVAATVDRSVGRRLNDTALWSVTRATPFWSFGPDGALVETASDTLPWSFDLATNASLGAAFAGARVNWLPNPRAEGLPPTSWVVPTGPAGVTITSSSFTASGMTGLELTITGSGSGVVQLQFGSLSGVVGSPGQTWSAAVFHQLVSGSMANLALSLLIRQGTAAGTFLGDSPGVSLVPTTAALSTQRGQVVMASAMAGTERVMSRVYITTSGAVDAVIRFALPQLEQAPFSSAPILPPVGSPSSFTRAQGLVSVPVRDLGARYNPRQGVVVVEWNSQPGPFTSAADTDAFGLISLGDTTANEVMGVVLNPAHNLIEFRRVVGGVAQTAASVSITPPAAGQSTRCAFAWDADAGLIQVAARGAAGTQITGQTSVPAITHVMPGRFSTTRPHFGGLRLAEIRPLAVFGSTLAAMT